MALALLFALTLQSVPVDELEQEGVRLGRYSTLFAVCAPHYEPDIEYGHGLADDFEGRAVAAGWSMDRVRAAYDEGRRLERIEVGLAGEASSLGRTEARRRLRTHYAALKRRCRDLASEAPGSIADIDGGDRVVDFALRRLR